VIRWPSISRFLAYVVLAEAAAQLLPLGLALFARDPGTKPLLVSIVASAAAGGILFAVSRRPVEELNRKEGILLVVSSWVAMCGFGAVPFYLSPHFPTLSDAIFESVSGFTTTGATALSAVENLPDSLQLWRCFSHWVGGLGIIVLGVAVLPLIGVGGMELYRAEFSGATSEKLTPRIAETAAAMWKIYIALTLAHYAALRVAGMGAFEAVCHSWSTMGTGGFSTRNLSIEAFHSAAVETVIIIFMLLAGINFTLHYRLFVERRPRRFFTDLELGAYLAIIGVAALGMAVILAVNSDLGYAQALRAALFQAASMSTSTGYSSANFELWPPFAQLTLLALMFAGGCTGSTAGGLKTARIVLLEKVVGREFRRMLERRGVFAVRFGGPVSEPTIQGLLNLVYLAFLVNFAASLVLTAFGVDVLTAISAVAACMFNVGPGLGAVGPYDNFGHLPALAKWALSFCMLAGRLEFYTFLVLFAPQFWRK
jgi:trk system potassium uptake protein TrkH